MQTQPSFSKDTTLSNTESEKDLQTLGVNTNLSNTEQSTQEIQSRALNATLRVDNHLLSNGVEGEWIGFNTLSNDITNPNAIINTLFHEASNKELHRKSNNDAYASNRGNSAESIFALKNYQGKNTNTISTLEWNQRENTRERLRGSGVSREGNKYNRRACLGEWRGSGERDNAEIRRRLLSFDQKGKWGKRINKFHHEHIFFEHEKGGNIGFTAQSGLGIFGVVHGKFFTETDPNVVTRYRKTDGKHYDDVMIEKSSGGCKKNQ